MLSVDTLIRNAMISGASSAYAGGASATASIDYPTHEISYKDIVKQVFVLQAANTMPTDGGRFIIVMHPHSLASLFNDEVFVDLFVQETDDSAIRSGKMGRIMNCDIYISSNAYENVDAGADSTTDVYSALIIGGDAFGVAGVSSLEPKLIDSGGSEEYTMTGKNVPAELIVKGTDSGGAENPLNQRGSIGWKVTNDVQILNSNWIINLEHANMFSDD